MHHASTTAQERFGLALGLLAVVLFGATVPLTRIAVAELDPIFLSCARAALAGLGALIWIAVAKPPLPKRSEAPALAVVVLCVVFGFATLMALGTATVPAAHGGIVLGLLPLATTIAAVFVAGERPSMAFWLIGVLGAGIVIAFAIRRAGGVHPSIGDVFLFGAVVAAGIGYSMSARLSARLGSAGVISWAVVIALPVSAPATVWLWPADAHLVSWQSWSALAYVGLVSQWLGFFAWNRGLAMGGIARVSQVQLVQTFVTLALAALINGETLDAETITVATLVVVTVMLGQRARVRR